MNLCLNDMLIENRHNCDYVVLFMINIRFLFILFQKMELKPSDICFSQAEINNVFDKNSCHPYKNLGETLDELVEGRCKISDIPSISVKRMNGKWVTADNRRLWVLRHLEKLGKCTTIWVNQTNFINSNKLILQMADELQGFTREDLPKACGIVR